MKNTFNYDRVNVIDYDYVEYEPWDDEEDMSPEEIFDNSTFNIVCKDSDYEVLFYEDDLTISDIEDRLGSDICDMIKKNVSDGNTSGTIGDILFINKRDVNLGDVESVNREAKRHFQTVNDYERGMRGYILVDGSILYFGDNKDHIQISCIDDMTVGRFVSLGNIRLLGNAISLEKAPTREQVDTLRKVISSYYDDEFYIDVVKYRGEGSGMYSENVFGVRYRDPEWRYVLGQLNQYFTDGIKPNVYESENISDAVTYVLNEMELADINESNIMSVLFRGCHTFDDYKFRVKVLLLGGVVSVSMLLGAVNMIKGISSDEKEELRTEIIEKEVENEDPIEDSDDTVYADSFTVSDSGKEHIKSYEKLRLVPYYATPYEKKHGILTVGYGHVVTDAEKDKYKLGVAITEKEADRLFDSDIKQSETYVKSAIMNSKINPNLKDATKYPQAMVDVMVSMMFSGYGNFVKSPFFARLQNCRYDKKTDTIDASDYNYTASAIKNSVITQGGKVVDGLVNRRSAEYEIAMAK